MRIVAATNRDLPAMIRAGTFREDLYFRLAVVPAPRPAPRRAARRTSPLLATHFAEAVARRRGRRPKTFTPAALEALARRRWPGNVRELQNLVERVLLMTPGPAVARRTSRPRTRAASGSGARPVEDISGAVRRSPRPATRSKRRVAKVLAETKGNVSGPPSVSASTGRRSTAR